MGEVERVRSAGAAAEHRGWIVHAAWRLAGGEPRVVLHGRLEDGRSFRVEEGRLRPHFFAAAEEAARLGSAPEARVEPCPLRDLAGRPVVRIETRLPAEATRLRERLRELGAEPLEADLRLPTRLLIDRGLGIDVAIRGAPEQPQDAGGPLVFRDPELGPCEARVALRSLSLDLETTPDASRILAAAWVGCGADEAHVVAGRAVRGAVAHADERSLLEALLARVAALDPDLLLGWNVVDFDLRVLARRCEALGMRCALGREGDAPYFLPGAGSGGRGARAELAGRVVLDGIPLARDALRLPDFRLETVARHVLGRGKKIDPSARDKAAEILRLHREDPEALAAYNLEDARLVPEILEREGLLALAVERSRLSGLPLDRVGASVAAFDRLYLPALRARGVVAPSVGAERRGAPVRGGALLDPRPGLWRGVAVFDFKSLYPSLIRTFQLDPRAHALARHDARAAADPVVARNGARFAREGALLPEILERLAARRRAARERGDRHADQALKIMMNALFGVLGTPGCRFFDPELANAITSFGQAVLRWTREAFEAQGVEVLYGDTDSVFVQLAETEPEGRRSRAEALRARAEAAVHARIRAEHRVEPHLELALERVFERLWLPRLRHGGAGSKKRYAGWVEGRLVAVGLEAVRRDWPAVAGRLQTGLLERLFTDRELAPFVRQVVEEVRAGRRDGDLVYAKRLRKGSVAKYTRSSPPHIQAARKAGLREGRMVRYVVTRRGPEPVVRGEPLPGDIDRTHYVEKVLRPVAESLLAEAGLYFDDLTGAPRQLDML